MADIQIEAKLLAQAVYEIRKLLAGYLGSENGGDLVVREAAHLAYTLHNEALSIITGGTFDKTEAVNKIRAVDRMFNENFTPIFETHLNNQPTDNSPG